MAGTRTAVVLCLLLSGAGSLVLEVVWGRLLRLVFGSTTLAISTVLVAYMLGLGLGGLAGGRFAARVRNGVRVYGLLEIGVAVYAFLVPSILALLPGWSGEVLADLSFWPAALARFAAVMAILLLPTVCMGATLPFLVAALVRGRAPVARSVGLLYGINTLGAVIGVFVATFALFPAVGVLATNTVGAGLDLLVGIVALALVAPRYDRLAPPEAAPAPRAEVAPPLHRWNPALLAYGTVGFTALTYEVCWTRALSMILGSSIYAFATMLASFLTGIALGSLVGRRWLDGLRRPLAAYGIGLGVLGLLSLLTLIAFRALPDAFISIVGMLGVSRLSITATGVLVSMAAMLGPTLVLGALFPLLVRALASGDHGRTVGDVYFVNTVGSAAGAFAAGFLLIPALGLRDTMALAMAINFAVAAAVLLWQRQWTGAPRLGFAGAALAAALAVLVSPPAWHSDSITRGVYRFPGDLLDVGVAPLPLAGVPGPEILFYREGINTTVSVHRSDGEVHLRVNGKADASSGGDQATQVLLGQVPMLFGPRAERVLVIGLASGMTVGSVALHEPAQVDVIELEPAMIEASRFFDEFNGRPLEKPFVRVIADDGRAFLARTRERYDVIISEPSNPWITGASSLFTREFFAAARRALAPGGRLFQWVQLYGIDPDGLRSIVAAVRAEFPHVYGFIDHIGEADLLLLASERPLAAADLPRWESLSEPVRRDLERIGNFSTMDLWSLLRLDSADLDALAAEAAAINSDDSMIVELDSPWRIWDVDVVPMNQDLIRRGHAGVLAVAERSGTPLDGDTVAELALSFAGPREDAEMARELAALATERGATAAAEMVLASVELAAKEEVDAQNLERLRRAAGAHPDSFLANLLLARALIRTEEAAEALERADAALRLAPGDLRARLARLEALLLMNAGEPAYAEAQALLQSPLRHDRDVVLYAAAAAADSGRMEEGIRQMRASVERSPSVPLYWSLLARMYAIEGQEEEARAAQENAERAERNLVLEMHQKALRAERVLSRERAIEALAMALAFDPEYEPARRDLQRLGVMSE